MKIVILMDTVKYSNHHVYAEKIEKALAAGNNFFVYNMSSGKPFHEAYRIIEGEKPELIITLDCAGFELKTELNSLSLNCLHCRAIHMLFEKTYKYGDLLDNLFSLSHFMFLPKGSDVSRFKETHNNIAYVGEMPNMIVEALEKWFAEVRIEMEL